MKRDRKFGWGLVGVAAAAVVAVLVPALVAFAAEPCCFANDRYEGTCTVILGEGETCGSVLAYLNNPMSSGKTYCGNTKVRGGWVQVDCRTGKSVMQKDAAGPALKAQKPAPAPEKGASR
jgi:hypothetical protein